MSPHPQLYYLHRTVYPPQVQDKETLVGGGIYLRKLPDLSLRARIFWITSFPRPLESLSGALPFQEPQSGDFLPTPEVLLFCLGFVVVVVPFNQQVFLMCLIYTQKCAKHWRSSVSCPGWPYRGDIAKSSQKQR